METADNEEIWALCRVPRDRIFFLRYTLEAYEGLCLSTTVPGSQGLVRVRSSAGLRAELAGVLEGLAQETPLEVLEWGSGEVPLREE